MPSIEDERIRNQVLHKSVFTYLAAGRTNLNTAQWTIHFNRSYSNKPHNFPVNSLYGIENCCKNASLALKNGLSQHKLSI